MQIVRDINALCEFRKNLCQRTQYLIDKKCSVSPYVENFKDRFGVEPTERFTKHSALTKEEYEQYEKELGYSAQMNKELNTMLDSIDKEIESNITKFLRGI